MGWVWGVKVRYKRNYWYDMITWVLQSNMHHIPGVTLGADRPNNQQIPGGNNKRVKSVQGEVGVPVRAGPAPQSGQRAVPVHGAQTAQEELHPRLLPAEWSQ